MTKKIDISDDLYKKLGQFAKPFETPEDVITKILNYYIDNHKQPIRKPEIESNDKVIKVDPENPESLTFTRVMISKIDNRLGSNSWNKLMRRIHEIAFNRFKSFDELRKISPANIKQGKFEDNGFHYLESIDISIQNNDSNIAFRNFYIMAKMLKIPFIITFKWKNKDEAKHPGCTGEIIWP